MVGLIEFDLESYDYMTKNENYENFYKNRMQPYRDGTFQVKEYFLLEL